MPAPQSAYNIKLLKGSTLENLQKLSLTQHTDIVRLLFSLLYCSASLTETVSLLFLFMTKITWRNERGAHSVSRRTLFSAVLAAIHAAYCLS